MTSNDHACNDQSSCPLTLRLLRAPVSFFCVLLEMLHSHVHFFNLSSASYFVLFSVDGGSSSGSPDLTVTPLTETSRQVGFSTLSARFHFLFLEFHYQTAFQDGGFALSTVSAVGQQIKIKACSELRHKETRFPSLFLLKVSRTNNFHAPLLSQFSNTASRHSVASFPHTSFTT